MHFFHYDNYIITTNPPSLHRRELDLIQPFPAWVISLIPPPNVVIAKLMVDYRSMNHQAARNYCNQNYINLNTMSLLKNIGDQFCRDLYGRRFLPSPSVTHMGRLIRSVPYASLFPSIAQVKVKPLTHPQERYCLPRSVT